MLSRYFAFVMLVITILAEVYLLSLAENFSDLVVTFLAHDFLSQP